MRRAEGGFYSSYDADSEGHEGKFYVWTADELDALLGDDAPVLRDVLGRDRGGNFEGKNILHVPRDPAERRTRSTACRRASSTSLADEATARAVRRPRARVRPGLDDKILASWNGLMVRALAEPRARSTTRASATRRWRTPSSLRANWCATGA